MNPLGTTLLLLSLVAAVDKPDKPSPKFPLGKETTYVTGPLDKDGYIDYEAALNDRLGKGFTPDKNAVVLLWKALGPTPDGGKGMPAEFFKRLGMEEPPANGTYIIGLVAFLKDHLKLDRDEIDAGIAQLNSASLRPCTAKDYPHLAAWLKANEKPLEVAIEATKRPDYFSPLVARRSEKGPGMLMAVLLTGAQKCREIASSLAIRAMLRVEAGQFNEAWQDLLACHRLGRLVGRGGPQLGALDPGCAIDQMARQADLAYLERANLTARQVQDRLKDVNNLPSIPPLVEHLQFERFLYLDALQTIRRGDKEEEQRALGKVDWEPALRNGNRWYDRMAVALRLKDRGERNAELDKIEADLKTLKKEATDLHDLEKHLFGKDSPDKTIGKSIGDSLITVTLPAVGKVMNSCERVEQTQRNLQVAFALAAYHSDNGRYPTKLDDLTPKYLAAVPSDLFSGKALIYRPSEKGYLFYSVGCSTAATTTDVGIFRRPSWGRPGGTDAAAGAKTPGQGD